MHSAFALFKRSLCYLYTIAILLSLTPAFLYAQTAADVDFDENGRVDFPDFLVFAQAFGGNDSNYDFNNDGSVNFPDFLVFAQFFGQEITNQKPIAEAGSYAIASKQDLITLNGSESRDPEGNPLTYVWSQISGDPVTLSDTNIAQPTFTPSEPGLYTFLLTVNDGIQDSKPDTAEVSIVGISEMALKVGSPDANFIYKSTDSNTLTFDIRGSAPSVTEGHILVNTVEPYFLKKVQRIVSQTQSELIVETVDAKITEVIQDGVFSFSSSQLSGAGKRALSDPTFSVSFTNEKFPIQSGITIAVESGKLSFDPDLQVDFDISKGQINRFSLVADGELEAELILDLSVENKIVLSKKFPLAELFPALKLLKKKLRFLIIWVPVFITIEPEFDFKVAFTTSGSSSANYGFRLSQSVKLGADYLNDEWQQVTATGAGNFQTVGPRFKHKSEVSLKGAIEANLSIKLYEVTGPFFRIGPFVSASTTPDFVDSKLDWQVNSGVDASWGVSLDDLFGLSAEVSWSKTLVGPNTLANGSFDFPAIIINPKTRTVQPGTNVIFTAEISQDDTSGVDWDVLGGGFITDEGIYTPFSPGTYGVVAISRADPTQTDTAQVIVEFPSQEDQNLRRFIISSQRDIDSLDVKDITRLKSLSIDWTDMESSPRGLSKITEVVEYLTINGTGDLSSILSQLTTVGGILNIKGTGNLGSILNQLTTVGRAFHIEGDIENLELSSLSAIGENLRIRANNLSRLTLPSLRVIGRDAIIMPQSGQSFTSSLERDLTIDFGNARIGGGLEFQRFSIVPEVDPMLGDISITFKGITAVGQDVIIDGMNNTSVTIDDLTFIGGRLEFSELTNLTLKDLTTIEESLAMVDKTRGVKVPTFSNIDITLGGATIGSLHLDFLPETITLKGIAKVEEDISINRGNSKYESQEEEPQQTIGFENSTIINQSLKLSLPDHDNPVSMSIGGIANIGGDLVVNGDIPSFHFDDLVQVEGNLSVRSRSLEWLSFENLNNVGGDLTLDCFSLVTIPLDYLKEVGGDFHFSLDKYSGGITFGELLRVGGDFDIRIGEFSPPDPVNQVYVSAFQLKTIGGRLGITSPSLASVEMDKLETVHSMGFGGPFLTSIGLRGLVSVTDETVETIKLNEGLQYLFLQSLKTFRGTLEIPSSMEFIYLDELTEIQTYTQDFGGIVTGSGLKVVGTSLKELRLGNLRKIITASGVGGSPGAFGFEIKDNAALEVLDLSNLETLQGPPNVEVEILNNSALASVTLPKLTKTPGGIHIRENPSIISIEMPALEEVSNIVGIRENAILNRVDLHSLKKLPGSFYLQNNPGLVTIDFSALEQAEWFEFSGNALLGSITIPSLVTVEDMIIRFNPALTSLASTRLSTAGGVTVRSTGVTLIDFPQLATARTFQITDNSSLRMLQAPSLKSISHTFSVAGNPNLSTNRVQQLANQLDNTGAFINIQGNGSP